MDDTVAAEPYADTPSRTNDRKPSGGRLRFAAHGALPTTGQASRPPVTLAGPRPREAIINNQTTPARRRTAETITLVDLAPNLGLDLEGTYALLREHGIRAAARPTTRIGRDVAERLRQARWGAIERDMRDAGIGVPEEDPEVARVRAALGDTSPAVGEHDADVAALARYFNVVPGSSTSPERGQRRPRPVRKRPTLG